MSEPRVHLIDDEDSVRNAMSFILDMADLPSRSYASALEFLDVAGSIREGCCRNRPADAPYERP